MKVYRVEDNRGIGPYMSNINGLYSVCLKMGNTATGHPSPRNDPSIKEWNRKYFCKKHKFGFNSINQLKNWMSKEIRLELSKLGLKLNVYETNEILEEFEYAYSDKQVVFIPDKFKWVEELDLASV